jgi:hypothetical protein
MKIIEPKIESDFSEAAVETALMDIRKSHHKDLFSLILHVSVFDVNGAVSMMLDDKYFRDIRYVHVTPEFRANEFSIQDDLNGVIFHSKGVC